METAPLATDFRSSDPAAAADFIDRTYGAFKPKVSGHHDRFHFRARVRPVGRSSVEHLLHTMATDTAVGAYDAYYAAYVRGGQFELRNGTKTLVLHPREALFAGPDIDHHTRWSRLDLAVVRLDRSLVDAVIDEVAGAGVRRADLDLSTPISAAHLRHWTATIAYVAREVLENPATSNAIIRAETDRLLVTTTLSTFAGAFLQATPVNEPTVVGTRTLRRAVGYIEANAELPITIADIADAARVTPRALQLAFRRQLQTTPMAYVRQVRLSGAHRELCNVADDATTIAEVAARWGFAHAGRFASLYRAEYGVSPAQTLRGAHLN